MHAIWSVKEGCKNIQNQGSKDRTDSGDTLGQSIKSYTREKNPSALCSRASRAASDSTSRRRSDALRNSASKWDHPPAACSATRHRLVAPDFPTTPLARFEASDFHTIIKVENWSLFPNGGGIFDPPPLSRSTCLPATTARPWASAATTSAPRRRTSSRRYIVNASAVPVRSAATAAAWRVCSVAWVVASSLRQPQAAVRPARP